MSKYDPLRRYLEHSDQKEVLMDFVEIENLLGSSLPMSARTYQAWWANEKRPHQPQKNAWGAAGYGVSWLDLSRKRVVFGRISDGVRTT